MIDKIYIINSINKSNRDKFIEMYKRASANNVVSIYSEQPIIDLLLTIQGKDFEKVKDIDVSDIKNVLDDCIDFTFRYIRASIERYRALDEKYTLFLHIKEEYLISMIRGLYTVNTILIYDKYIMPKVPDDLDIGKSIDYNFKYNCTNDSFMDLALAVVEFINLERSSNFVL